RCQSKRPQLRAVSLGPLLLHTDLRTRTLVASLVAHAELVLDISHSRNVLDDLFREAFCIPLVDPAAERHVAAHHVDLHARGVDPIVIGQQLADRFADALVGALVVHRPLAAMAAWIVPRRLAVIATRLSAVAEALAIGILAVAVARPAFVPSVLLVA